MLVLNEDQRQSEPTRATLKLFSCKLLLFNVFEKKNQTKIFFFSNLTHFELLIKLLVF